MKVLIATDKFKGSLSSVEVCRAISRGLIGCYGEDGVQIVEQPMADGGTGTLEVLERILPSDGLKKVLIRTIDAFREPFDVEILLRGDVAYIESAKIVGLCLNPDEEMEGRNNPLYATSYGLGIAMRVAVKRYFAKKLVIGLGGSLTNDGGMGMLAGLGFSFTDANGHSLYPIDGMLEMKNIGKISMPGFCGVEIVMLADVMNPLLGDRGATKIYAEQKGASKEDIFLLEEIMIRYSMVAEKFLCKSREEFEDVSGAGAAGGIGAALHGFLGAEIIQGWKYLADLVGLEKQIREADIVITGEGIFDSQTLHGKLPFGVITLAKKYDKKIWIVCGECKLSGRELASMGVERVTEILKLAGGDRKRSISEAEYFLSQCDHVSL